MALKTPEQYEDSLRKMNFKIYLMGERVENPVDHPIIRPSMNSVKMTSTPPTPYTHILMFFRISSPRSLMT